MMVDSITRHIDELPAHASQTSNAKEGVMIFLLLEPSQAQKA